MHQMVEFTFDFTLHSQYNFHLLVSIVHLCSTKHKLIGF